MFCELKKNIENGLQHLSVSNTGTQVPGSDTQQSFTAKVRSVAIKAVQKGQARKEWWRGCPLHQEMDIL